MALFNTFYSWYLRSRLKLIEQATLYPADTQIRVFNTLIPQMRETAWGRHYGYQSIQTPDDFRKQIPVQGYEAIKPWIDRMLQGEQNVLWPTEIHWFAKSSGTTADKSKFIPVSYDSLEHCHIKAARDLLAIYCNNYSDTQIFSGKGLVMGGSHQINTINQKTSYGDLSAVLIQNLPFWVHYIRTPHLEVALMADWEEKLEKMAKETIWEDVTNISGVPTWTLVLLKRILSENNKKNIKEIWPNLEVYFHGGVSFEPYRNQFEELCQNEIRFMETYNASEGFFGLQDSLDGDDLLLLLDYGIYFEFMPMFEYGKEYPQTLLLHEVKTDENYAVIITTNSGLSRYILGDTVRFTSTDPYRIKISGRTRHYINAFGEELMIENADKALTETCKKLNLKMVNYTAAPKYAVHGSDDARHEWIIEFEHPPENRSEFTLIMDEELKKTNSDYEAKRYKNIAMQIPLVHFAPCGTFHRYLASKGKLGGQNKVPRLCNDRKIIEDVLVYI